MLWNLNLTLGWGAKEGNGGVYPSFGFCAFRVPVKVNVINVNKNLSLFEKQGCRFDSKSGIDYLQADQDGVGFRPGIFKWRTPAEIIYIHGCPRIAKVMKIWSTKIKIVNADLYVS